MSNEKFKGCYHCGTELMPDYDNVGCLVCKSRKACMLMTKETAVAKQKQWENLISETIK